MRNNSRFVFLVLLLVVPVGCSTISQVQQTKWAETAPVCIGKSDCEAKWAAARDWIQQKSGYKIQIYSDDLIETYNSVQYDTKLAVRATKHLVVSFPNGNKMYNIGVAMSCGNILGCIPPINDAILDFNSYVSKVSIVDESCYIDILDENSPRLGSVTQWSKNTERQIVNTICQPSPAYNAGIRYGDAYKVIGNVVITKESDYDAAIKKLNFGDTVMVEIERNGMMNFFEVKLPTKEEVLSMKHPAQASQVVRKTPANVEEKLEALSRMLQKKLITTEDYEAKKKQILLDM